MQVANQLTGFVQTKYQEARKGAKDSYEAASLICRYTADKVQDFVRTNKKEILFGGCTAVTAFFSPQVFVPVMIATILVRTVATEFMKDQVKESSCLKPSIYYGPNYVSRIWLTLATIAAVDAIALGTLFYTHTLWVSAFPVALGAVAAGEMAYRFGSDIVTRYL